MRLKAIFPNPDRALWPNQFVKARLRLTVRKGALVIPAVAVQRGPQGAFVYVANGDQAELRNVGVERIEGEDALISQGLTAGEKVVREGQSQLRPGAKLALRESGGGGARSPPAATPGSGAGAPASGARRRRRQQAQGPEGAAVNVSEPFIRRPVGTSLLMIGVAVAGVAAYNQLPVSALPQVDYPTIVVSTILPGASADTMVSAVTTPLERQLGQIPSLAHLTSVSSAASSQITLQFTLDRDIDSAEQDVQAAINAASNLLPRRCRRRRPTARATRPTCRSSRWRSARTPRRCRWSTTTPTRSWRRSCRRSRASAWSPSTAGSGRRCACRSIRWRWPGAGSGLEDVRSVLALANVNQPKGNLDGPRQNYLVSANDQLASAEGYKPLVIAYQNGAPVRLSDVAKVLDGVENAQLAGWANEHPAVILNVQRQPGANLIEVAERVKTLLPRLEASLPQGIKVDILSDRTETVRASVRDVEFTLVLTMILVVAVIYLFLRTLRATIIPGVAVPLSLIATFGVMLLLGYSLNNLTLMALTISTGFVVDDAIVMIENIARHIEEGDAPFTAALKGSKQIGFTIVSLTVSLVAVLIPLLFMGGIIGRLFREFAVTLSTAIVASAIISLTLTAMMCGHILRPIRKEDEGRVARASEAAFDWMVRIYDRGLGWVLDHQALTLAATVATVALTFFLAVVIPKGLFPQQDTGMLLGITEAPHRRLVPGDDGAPAARRSTSSASIPTSTTSPRSSAPTAPTPPSRRGRLSITLKSRDQRKADAQEIIDRLSAKLAAARPASPSTCRRCRTSSSRAR